MSTRVPILREVAKAAKLDLTAEKEVKFEEAKAALNAEAKENWQHESWHVEQAAVIAETLDWGFRHETKFPSFFPSKFVGEDEQVVLKERRGLRAFWTSRSGEVDESQLRQSLWEIPKDSLGWHVREFDRNVRNDYAETIAQLIPLAKLQEETETYRRILGVLGTAIDVSSPYYISGSFDESTLRDAVTDVADTPIPSNARMVNGISIVGRRRAIQEILDFTSFNDNTRDSIARTGVLGTYYGADVVTLDNYQDEDGVAFLPDDELWVIGGGVGLFVSWGGSVVRQWMENKVDYRHYKSMRDVNAVVTHPEVARRIVLDGSSS